MTVTHLPVPAPVEAAPEAPSRGLTPPHDVEAERSVLGAALISRPALADLVDLGLRPRDFYRPAHELVWSAILQLHASGQPVDVVTVTAALQSAGELRRVGGPAAVHELSAAVPSPASAVHYAGIVQERAVARALVGAGQQITQLGYATGSDIDEAVHAAQAQVAAVAERRAGPGGEVDMGAALDQLMDELEEGIGTAVPTGLGDLDAALSGGLRPGTITTVGARPAVGKTAFALSVVLHVAAAGYPVGLTSLEMSRTDLLIRAAASLGGLDYTRLQEAHVGKIKLTESEWRALARANGTIRESDLEIYDHGVRVGQIRAGIRSMQRRKGSCGLWVVDYLGLITPDDTRVNREQQVSQMSRALKLAALELNVPILLLHQLNRESERAAREPRMSDLRDSGSVEQDSDAVLLLHRDLEASPHLMGANVAKNRRGRTAPLVLDFHGSHQRVTTHQWRPSDAAAGR